MSFGYDLLGDMVTGGSGTGRTWAATFNTAAQLTQVSTNYLTSTESGTLVSGIQYNALGLPVSSLLASGVQETRSYDNRRRLLSYSAGQKYTVSGLTYAGNNNVLKALDSENGAWSYTYDDFRRLATASSSSQGFSYSYDRYGNRWQQNLTAGAGPSPQYSFDANNHITAAGLIYDAAGNETNDTFHTYTYDAENRVTAVDGGTTGTYVYNARGLRVGRKNSTGNVEYLFDPTGEQITEITAGTATALQNEVLVGRHWATQRSTTYFPHSDWLGTMRVLTGLTGSVVESSTGLPFGDGAVNTGSDFSPFHFTEQPHDTESNLEHFPLRQYSSTQGRWVSPDPAGLGAVDISNPQTWDRYAYVSNNPLSLIDPAGTDGCDADSDSVTCDLSFSYGSSDSGSWGWYSDSFNGNNGASLSGSAAVTGFDPVTQRYIGDVDVSMNIAANVAALAPAMQRANATVKTFMAGQAIQVGVAAAVIAGPAVATHVAARGLGWYYAYAGTGVGVVLGRYPDYTQKAEEMGANALNVGSRGWDRGVYSFFNNAGEWWTLNQSYLQAQIFRGQQFTLSNVPWMQGGSYFEMELEYLQSRGIGWSYTPFDLGPLNWHLGD
jgi:RHS repeat-associated protein